MRFVHVCVCDAVWISHDVEYRSREGRRLIQGVRWFRRKESGRFPLDTDGGIGTKPPDGHHRLFHATNWDALPHMFSPPGALRGTLALSSNIRLCYAVDAVCVFVCVCVCRR